MNCVIKTHIIPGHVGHPTARGSMFRHVDGTGAVYAVGASAVLAELLRAKITVQKPAGLYRFLIQHNFIGVDVFLKHR